VTSLAKADGMRPQSMGATIAAWRLPVSSQAPQTRVMAGRPSFQSLLLPRKIAAGRAAKEDWLFRSIKGKLNAAEQEQLACAVLLLKRLVEE